MVETQRWIQCMPMDELRLSTLDEYSRLAAGIIVARYPDWSAFAKFSAHADGLGDSIEFNLASPSPGVEHGLWVSTANQELSVGFDVHHCHFNDYEHPLNVDRIESGLQLLDGILSERVGVIAWYDGEELTASRWLDLPHVGALPTPFEKMPDWMYGLGFANRYDRLVIRSWNGTFDRDETCQITT